MRDTALKMQNRSDRGRKMKGGHMQIDGAVIDG